MKSSYKSQYDKMTKTPVWKLVTILGIPTTISMLVTNIYNMADTYFVSQMGNSASGAVGVVFGLMAIIQAFGFMLGHGAGSIISRRLGSKDVDTATKMASTSFFSSLIIGTLIGALGLIFINPLMILLGSTPTILPYARTYATFILIAAPLMTSSFVLNNMLRYEGKAAFAMIGLTAGAFINIIGDYIFMKKLGMGIEGAGLSTALSQMISFIMLLSVFLAGKTSSKLKLKYMSRDIKDYVDIAVTGFPSLVRQGLNSISTMVLNWQAGLYGDATVAAMTIVNRICFFVFAIGLGIGQGFQPVSAFNYGAGKYKRVKKAFIFTAVVGEITLGIMAIVGIFISKDLISLFRDDKEVIAIGTFALAMQLVSLFFQPVSVASNMMFQSIGKNIPATFLSMLRSGLYFIPVILILSKVKGLLGIEIAQPIADFMAFVTTIPFLVYFFRRLPKEDEPDVCMVNNKEIDEE